jgi:hypothetical protein
MNKIIWHNERIIAHLESALEHVRDLAEMTELKDNEEVGFVFSHLQSALSEVCFLKDKCEEGE